MKRISLGMLLLSFLFSFCEEVRKEFYPSGKLKSEVYAHETCGWIKRYYESGNIMIYIPMKYGKYNGVSSIYFINGKKAYDTQFENDFENGTQKVFYASGKLQAIHLMQNGNPIGEGKEFYESGKIAAIWKYEGKIAKGTTFYETGEILSNCLYEDIAIVSLKFFDRKGKVLNGSFQSYFNSGKLQLKGCFNAGIPDKLYQSYYESGKLKYEGFFNKNKPEGEHRIYFEDGNIMYRIPYVNGVLDGVVKYSPPFIENLIIPIIYEKGKKISK